MSKKIRETTIETEQNSEEEKGQEIAEKLDAFFEGISSDMTIEIYRDQPKHLEGFLESIVVSDLEKPVDLQYLSKQWGGKVLRLMIRQNGKFIKRVLVPLKSYPPLFWGEKMDDRPGFANKTAEPLEQKREDPFDHYMKMQELISKQQQAFRELQPQNTDIATILVPLLTSLMERQFTQQQIERQPIQETLSTLRAMKEFMGETSPQISPNSGNPDDVFLPTILKLGEKLLENTGQNKVQNQPAPNNIRQLSPPVKPMIPIPQPPQNMPQRQENQSFPINDNIQQHTINPSYISQIVKNLTPEQLAEVISAGIDQMAPENAEAAFHILAERMGFEYDAIEDTESGDTTDYSEEILEPEIDNGRDGQTDRTGNQSRS